ncbi:MAG: type II toxin-antitoxin system HicB family antitoxin [Reichenbachiella sp.]
MAVEKYSINLEWDNDEKKYIATSPEHPECVAVGITKPEARRKLDIAIENWLKAIRSQASKTKGLKIGYTRASFIVQEGLLEQLKLYASIEGVSMKEALENSMKYFLKSKKIQKIIHSQDD